MILAICMNATVLLEQPRNSFLEYYPRFREWMEMLQNIGGINAVPLLLYSLRFTINLPSHQVQADLDIQFIESIWSIFARVVPQVGRLFGSNMSQSLAGFFLEWCCSMI